MLRLVGSVLCAAFAATLVCASGSFAHPPRSPWIDGREWRQEERVNQGIRSGQLTPREAVRLEREQARIRYHERMMKADGLFTRSERARLHRELNRADRHIYRQKHDRQRIALR